MPQANTAPALPLKMAVTSSQAAFNTPDDGGVISMLFDTFALRWPLPVGAETPSGPIETVRKVGIIGQPGAAFAIDLWGSCQPDGAAGCAAEMEISHRGGEVITSPIVPAVSIEHRFEGHFNASGRLMISMRISIDGETPGRGDRIISIDALDITTGQSAA